MMTLLAAGISAILFGGILSLFFKDRFKSRIVCLFTGAGAVMTLIPAFSALLGGTILTAEFELSYPVGTVSVVVDPLAAFFVILISVMCFIASIYTMGYMKSYNDKGHTLSSHYLFLSMLTSSMLAVVVIQNAIAFLMAWEIMSLASFFLVVFENDKKEVRKAGLNYLIAMHVGVIFLMFAFIILTLRSGSQDFSSFSAAFGTGRGFTDIVFVLTFVGFGTKAGFVPFHTWLPKAHPAAPAHVSAIMSGIMIKTGIYGILRIISLIPGPSREIAYFVLIISLLSGIFGVAYAIAQHNVKTLLAYHSVENIGIIGLGIGLGLLGLSYGNNMLAVLGFAGGILHILNHSIFKTLLFFSVGSVYQKTHNLNMDTLGGLTKAMPFTAAAFLTGSLAITGLPPFNGFVSEFFIYSGMFSGFGRSGAPLSITLVLSFAGLAFIGAMALLCFTKAFGSVFSGTPRIPAPAMTADAAPSMKTAMALQMLMIVMIGLFSRHAFKAVSLVSSGFTPQSADALKGYDKTLTALTQGLFIFAALFAFFLLFRGLLLKGRQVTRFKTWDCGYRAGNPHMQYTASSYAHSFIGLISPALDREVAIKDPSGLFPGDSHYKTHVSDRFETGVILPLINGLKRLLKAFSWIQNGNTQQYLLYGLVFLIAITIWIMAV